MWCRESIFVEKSTIDFPIFLLFFNTKFPIFPIFSILSFPFSYLFEQPCRWTPCSKGIGAAVKFFTQGKIKTTAHDNPKSNYYATKAEWIDSKTSIDQ